MDRLTNCNARDEAQKNGLKFYDPPGPCRSGHNSKRYTRSGICRDCILKTYRKGSFSNSDKDRAIKTLVYVVDAEGRVKIGLAANIETRFQVIKTHCPLDVRLVYTTEYMFRGDARKIEDACHIKFKSKNIQGEWFLADYADVVEFIEELRKQRTVAGDFLQQEIGGV